jgi:transposase-like protein
MGTDLTAPIYTDDAAARAHLEGLRWPHGPVCPHCGVVDQATRLAGEAHRPGLLECRACRRQFSVTVGTVFERSHVPLHKWVLATHLMSASKKGISAHQLHRMLGVTYKTAWFMAHRIREAMTDPSPGPIGGEGKVIEADETYIGKAENAAEVLKNRKRKVTKSGKSGPAGKRPIVALVERGGEVRAEHMPKVTAKNVRDVLVKHADRRSALHTDESRLYPVVGREYASHQTVRHSAGEYARDGVHTNTVEGFFGVFKRGFRGIYQHCGEQHLQRYLNEFAFRYDNRVALGVDDNARAVAALKGIEGKRLTYRRTDEAQDA